MVALISTMSSVRTLAERVERLSILLGRLELVAAEEQSTGGSQGGGSDASMIKPCSSYRELINAWRKALRWTDGLDHALAVMLAAVASTKIVGDQLWIRIMSPPSTAKTTIAEGLATNKRYVRAVDTLTSLISGYQTDADGSNNLSFVGEIRDKTLVIKDGDPLLSNPQLPKILSQLRAFYDRNLRTRYGNLMSKDHEGVNCTVLMCGTSALHQLDSSELGERFLSCVIMEGIDDELEDEVLTRVAYRADRNLALEADGKPETQYEPELVEAMALTGGYVGWLRENAIDRMSRIVNPDEAIRYCRRLGKFVAHMRARPSTRQDELAEREFAARLVSQLVRLSKCLALVLNRAEVDSAVMARVRRVAMDTSRGVTLAIANLLYARPEGLGTGDLAFQTNCPDDRMRHLLRFLKGIRVVEVYVPVVKGGKQRACYRLTSPMRRLYRDVMELASELSN